MNEQVLEDELGFTESEIVRPDECAIHVFYPYISRVGIAIFFLADSVFSSE